MSLAKLLKLTRPWKFPLQSVCRIGFNMSAKNTKQKQQKTRSYIQCLFGIRCA